MHAYDSLYNIVCFTCTTKCPLIDNNDRIVNHMWDSLGKWPIMHFLAKMSYYHFHVPY